MLEAYIFARLHLLINLSLNRGTKMNSFSMAAYTRKTRKERFYSITDNWTDIFLSRKPWSPPQYTYIRIDINK